MPQFPDMPFVPLGTKIPKILHQKFSNAIPEVLQTTVSNLASQNPLWDHRLYDDTDAEKFIFDNYGRKVLDIYNLVSPEYGAARADLFRYLLIYKVGGIYLDLKSSFNRPIDEVISGNESYILAKWRNRVGDVHENWGLHGDYDFPGGEFQQWHIIAARGHPFLRAVINQVVKNILSYDATTYGVGRIGVLKTTGPIPYTLAITPLIKKFSCTILPDETYMSLTYSALLATSHTSLFKNHYTTNKSPVIRHTGLRGVLDRAKLTVLNHQSLVKSTIKDRLRCF